MKKMINSKQFTLRCKVYDLNVLHVDSDIFSSIFSDIDVEYGKTAKMTITKSKIHK